MPPVATYPACLVTDPPYDLLVDRTHRPPPGWAAGLALACGLVASGSCCCAAQAPALAPALLLASFAAFVLLVGLVAVLAERGDLWLDAWHTEHSHRGSSWGFAVRWPWRLGSPWRGAALPAWRGPGFRVAVGSAEFGFLRFSRLRSWGFANLGEHRAR